MAIPVRSGGRKAESPAPGKTAGAEYTGGTCSADAEQDMKRQRLSITLLLLCAACADRGATLRGTLTDEASGAYLQAADGAEPIELQDDGSFEVSGLAPQPALIRIIGMRGDTATLTVDGFPADAEVALWNVRRTGGGLAFPTTVELQGVNAVRVNGIRMAGAGALPRQVNIQPATVLAVADDGGALLVRPTDAALPDLRVLVASASVTDAEGEPALTRRLQFGDTVRVHGHSEHGYVIADTLVLPASARRPAAPPPEPPPVSPRNRLPGRPIVPREITPEVRKRIREEFESRGNDEAARRLRNEVNQRQNEAREQAKNHDKEARKREQDRGRGKAKGKRKKDGGRR